LAKFTAIRRVVCGAAHAQILNWWNYSEWDRLPQDAKTAYIAGAFDSLVDLQPPKSKQEWRSITANACSMLA
jgi:hypothetical protein